MWFNQIALGGIVRVASIVNFLDCYSIDGMTAEEQTLMNENINQFFIDNNYSDEQKKICISDIVSSIIQSLNTENQLKPQTEIETEVAISNPDDKTEVAIKTNVSIGQISERGWQGFYDLIGGVQMLGMKKHNGTPVTELKGGKQKSQAQRIMKQYLDVAPRTDLGRYALQATDIFETPILSVFDGRGKHSIGYYSKRLFPIFIDYLIDIYNGENQIYTNVTRLAKDIKIVDRRYRTKKDFTNINEKFTIKMMNRFYSKANKELEQVLFRMLDNLQDNYSVISYEKNFCIFTQDGKLHTSTASEKSIIRKSQAKILKEFNAKSMFVIFVRNQAEQFYKRVTEYINETYDLDWIKYKNQIEINIEDIDSLIELRETFLKDNNFDSAKALKEVKTKLATKIYKSNLSDYHKSQEKEIQSVLDDSNIDDTIKACFEAGIYSIKELKKDGIIKEIPFHYWESTLDTQNAIIEMLIGSINYCCTSNTIDDDLPF